MPFIYGKNELNFIASRPNVRNYVWYVYNTELQIYGQMTVKRLFITQATGIPKHLPRVLQYLILINVLSIMITKRIKNLLLLNKFKAPRQSENGEME
jgi:hypothetical protein